MMLHLVTFSMWTPEHPLRRELLTDRPISINTRTQLVCIGGSVMALAPGPILVERKE